MACTGARSGMKRSPRTRTSLEVIVFGLFAHGVMLCLAGAGTSHDQGNRWQSRDPNSIISVTGS